MGCSDRPPTFRMWKPPGAKSHAEALRGTRISARARGYDSRWDRLSVAFRRSHPFCRFCEQEDRDTLTDVVDHIIPAAWRPELKYAWKNLQPLCNDHHNITKQKMERFAALEMRVEELPAWCASLEARPREIFLVDPRLTKSADCG